MIRAWPSVASAGGDAHSVAIGIVAGISTREGCVRTGCFVMRGVRLAGKVCESVGDGDVRKESTARRSLGG